MAWRLAPLLQGISTSSDLAAATMDLMKRDFDGIGVSCQGDRRPADQRGVLTCLTWHCATNVADL
jgi:hypothetical protein